MNFCLISTKKNLTLIRSHKKALCWIEQQVLATVILTELRIVSIWIKSYLVKAHPINLGRAAYAPQVQWIIQDSRFFIKMLGTYQNFHLRLKILHMLIMTINNESVSRYLLYQTPGSSTIHTCEKVYQSSEFLIESVTHVIPLCSRVIRGEYFYLWAWLRLYIHASQLLRQVSRVWGGADDSISLHAFCPVGCRLGLTCAAMSVWCAALMFVSK